MNFPVKKSLLLCGVLMSVTHPAAYAGNISWLGKSLVATLLASADQTHAYPQRNRNFPAHASEDSATEHFLVHENDADPATQIERKVAPKVDVKYGAFSLEPDSAKETALYNPGNPTESAQSDTLQVQFNVTDTQNGSFDIENIQAIVANDTLTILLELPSNIQPTSKPSSENPSVSEHNTLEIVLNISGAEVENGTYEIPCATAVIENDTCEVIFDLNAISINTINMDTERHVEANGSSGRSYTSQKSHRHGSKKSSDSKIFRF